MDINEEFDLLSEYMEYFVEANYEKIVYNIGFKDWEKDGKHGPSPKLKVINERYLDPYSFQAWAYYTKDIML